MQDTRTNELRVGATPEEAAQRIRPEDQGPTFERGEIVTVKGYRYEIVKLRPNRITLVPHGPISEQEQASEDLGRRLRSIRGAR